VWVVWRWHGGGVFHLQLSKTTDAAHSSCHNHILRSNLRQRKLFGVTITLLFARIVSFSGEVQIKMRNYNDGKS